MQLVELVDGRGFAIVDDEDYGRVAGYRWRMRHDGYVVRSVEGGYTRINLEHEILPRRDGFVVDHINHQTIDCRRANLRYATPGQNQLNRRSRSRASAYRGVARTKHGTWRAQIHRHGKQHYLGAFKTELEAANAYDAAAVKHFGEFAVLNRAFTETVGAAT